MRIPGRPNHSPRRQIGAIESFHMIDNSKQDGLDGLSLHDFTMFLEEIQVQPLWRKNADKEMDFADGNQLDSELLFRQSQLGIPPAIENLIGPALLSVQGFEAKTRTDWRVTPDGETGGQEVSDALNFKLNQAERHSKADESCSDAFRSEIGVGIGWVEVSRQSDPFKYPYRCQAIHRNEIYWDMKAKECDLSDARFLIRKRWMHKQRAALVFPKSADLIEQIMSNWQGYLDGSVDGEGSTGLSKAWDEQRGWSIEESMWYDHSKAHVCIFEVWYRVWKNITVLTSMDGKVIEYDKSNVAHTVGLASGQLTPSKAIVAKLRRGYWLGPHRLDDAPSPYSHRNFPYVPFWCFREDRTGVPFGFIRGMMYQQEALNSGTSKMRWGMSSVRTERTKGAVAMTDDNFRKMIARVDADVILDAEHMSQPGATFKVQRDFQMNEQQYKMLNDARAAIERVSAINASFSGRQGTATSGKQEDTQVEQSTQTLASPIAKFKRGRAMIGEILLSFIVEDIGRTPTTVVIEGNAVEEDRTVELNVESQDPELGYAFLTNDVARTRLKVSLEDVPSTTSYRGQQLNAMSEAVKSLPAQYQAAILPFMVSLMDVPFKKQVVEVIRKVSDQQSPEQTQQQIEQGIKDGVIKAGHDLKGRELDMRERKTDAEINAIVAQAVQTGVQSAFSAMQAANQIVMMPQVAPIADIIMQGAGYQRPNPMGQDPNFPTPAVPTYPGGQAAAPSAIPPEMTTDQNTHPNFPALAQEPGTGMAGIETARTQDNLSGVAS